MAKIILGFLLVAAFSLACAGMTLAAPVSPAGGGLSVFGEYSEWYNSSIIGAGYGLGDNLTVGAFYAFDSSGELGLYADMAFGPIVLSGEMFFEGSFSENCGMISALYTLDLDPVTLGVGVGVDYYDWEFSYFYAKATAEIRLDAVGIYGGVIYYPDFDETSCHLGMNYLF